MTEETYAEMFSELQKTYGPQAEGWAVHFRSSVIDLDDELVLEAYHICIRKQPPRSFPTIDRFAGYIEEARKNVKTKDNPRPLTRPRVGYIRNTERGRAGLALMMRVYNEGYTDDVIAELKATWPRDPKTGEPHDWDAEKRNVARLLVSQK